MTRLDPTQTEIATLLFSLPEAAGYALAGGAALLAAGTIDRPTRDLDAFIAATPTQPPGDVTTLAATLIETLEANGWTVTIVRRHQTFHRLNAARHDDWVEIDLAVDSPRLFPTTTIDGIPMLDPRDLAARKILAILDRAEGRDFTDLEALQRDHPSTAIIDWARQLDPGLAHTDIARAFEQLERLDDSELPTADPAATRRLFDEWADELQKAGL
ncbi:MAG: nucleotidyl transferase AbiEii/AbiGii toxin family protein [Acidimicrobiales bacterium]